jgi:hypothetical protein
VLLWWLLLHPGDRCYSIYDVAVRVAAWLTIAFAVLSATAVFLPGLDVEIGGVRLTRKTSLSLYKVAADREVARALLARYAHAGSRQYGEKLADRLLEHAGAHAKKLHVDDARDAMSTLDEVSDDDVRRAGFAVVALTIAYLALLAIAVALPFGDTMRGTYSRWRAIVVVAVTTLAVVLAIGVHLGWSAAAFEANDELGTSSFALGVGAWLMPIGACGALASAIALLVQHVRSAAKPHAEAA